MAFDVTSELLKFNSNRENRELMAFYNRKSYMELLGVARKEEQHSAFLAWLLKGSDIECNIEDSPMMWFLQVLANRENTIRNKNIRMPTQLKSAILSRTLKFHIEEVKNEKKVRDVNDTYFKAKNIKCEDELDIYIKLSIQGIPIIDELEIIIENKIFSKEEGPKRNATTTYGTQCQTVRYYMACCKNKNKNNFQLYVYLCPDPTRYSTNNCQSRNYIHIYYQDLLNYILIPLVDKTDSERIRLIIREYIDCLSLPTLDVKESKRVVLARSTEEEKALDEFKTRNMELLYEIMKVQIKKIYKKTLTSDEEILYDFASANGNLMYAVCNVGNINTSTPTYVVYQDLKAYNNSGFGVRFAEFFASKVENEVNNVQDLQTELNNKIGLNTTGIYYSTPNQQKQCKEIENYKFPLYVTKGTWENTRTTGLLSKLEKSLSNIHIDGFDWEKIA